MHKNLWAPWRMAYINQLDPGQGDPTQPKACFLCEAAASGNRDEGHLVLLNDQRGQILLNRYPYTNGHLLAAPREHLGDLTDMTPAGRCNLMELTHLGEQLLRTALNPQGINIGINIGRCAGAGLPGHLHVHILPRWNGDTNFMQTVGQVRVIPQALEASYQQLVHALSTITQA